MVLSDKVAQDSGHAKHSGGTGLQLLLPENTYRYLPAYFQCEVGS